MNNPVNSTNTNNNPMKRKNNDNNTPLKKIPKHKNAKSIPIISEYDKKFSDYLSSKQIHLKDRHYLCDKHIEYFTNLLRNNINIKNIFEIGFYYGHVSDILLNCRNDIRVTSVDNSLNDTVSNFCKPYLILI